MNQLTSEELQAIRARAERASKGRWSVNVSVDYCDNCKNGYEIVQSELFLAPIVAELRNREDAEFIAHAREDIPKLLAEIERLRAGIERAINETSCDDTWDYLNRLLEGKETTDLPYRIGGDSE